MDEGRKVWVPDPTEGYRLGHIKDIKTDAVTVQPLNPNEKPITAAYGQVFPCEEYEDKDVDDNCKKQ